VFDNIVPKVGDFLTRSRNENNWNSSRRYSERNRASDSASGSGNERKVFGHLLL
jgi:hypothetical protein